MARVVAGLGWGGQRFAEKELGWNRGTIRKGQWELETAIEFEDRFRERGRKGAEEHLPKLLEDILWIVEPASQTDPTFRSTRLYSPLTAKEVWRRLIEKKGYAEEQLPCERTISNKLHALAIRPQKVAKCKPLKKIPETDAIFEQVHATNRQSDADPGMVRISLDTKAAVKVGEFSRGGYSRTPGKALDHDYAAQATLKPFGVLVPATAESYLWFSTSNVTADFMADRLEELWPRLREQFGDPHTVVINADNGPESSGHRKQWLKRMVQFADRFGVTVELAYYPPYHSKYNPIERVWGVLEKHWMGELLQSIDKVLGLARTMTFRAVAPMVELVTKTYEKAVKVAAGDMATINARIDRLTGLQSWFITILPQPFLG